MISLQTFFRDTKFFLFAVLSGGVILTTAFLGQKSFSFDEVFSVVSVRNLGEMLRMFWTEEGNMWSYYLPLFFWRNLGEDEFTIRLLSVLFALLTIPVIYLLSKKIFNRKVSQISTVLLLLNFLFIYYAQMARSYSLLLLTSSLSSLMFLYSLEKRSFKNWFLYGVICTVGLYSHLYAGLVILAQQAVLIFLPYKKIPFKAIFFTNIFIVELTLPLILAPSFHGNQINWLTKPSLKSLVGVFAIISSDFLPLFLISLAIFGYGLYRLKENLFRFRNPDNFKYLFLISYMFVPILSAFIFSLFFKPIYESVYFIITLTPLTLILAFGFSKIRSKIAFRGLLLLFIALSLFRLYGWYLGDQRIKWVINNSNADWKSVSEFLYRDAKEQDGLIFYPYFNIEPIEFYLKKDGDYKFKLIELSPTHYQLGGGDKLVDPTPNSLESLSSNYRRIWFVVSDDKTEIFDRFRQKQLIENFLRSHYVLKYRKEFGELNVNLYERSDE